MVVTHTANGGEAAVFLAERLMTVQLDDAHYAAQLLERLKWAGDDAEHAEHEAASRNVTRRIAHETDLVANQPPKRPQTAGSRPRGLFGPIVRISRAFHPET
jgi:thioesterase domain-containing protein